MITESAQDSAEIYRSAMMTENSLGCILNPDPDPSAPDVNGTFGYINSTATMETTNKIPEESE